jgi:hypothetical protein
MSFEMTSMKPFCCLRIYASSRREFPYQNDYKSMTMTLKLLKCLISKLSTKTSGEKGHKGNIVLTKFLKGLIDKFNWLEKITIKAISSKNLANDCLLWQRDKTQF